MTLESTLKIDPATLQNSNELDTLQLSPPSPQQSQTENEDEVKKNNELETESQLKRKRTLEKENIQSQLLKITKEFFLVQSNETSESNDSHNTTDNQLDLTSQLSNLEQKLTSQINENDTDLFTNNNLGEALNDVGEEEVLKQGASIMLTGTPTP